MKPVQAVHARLRQRPAKMRRQSIPAGFAVWFWLTSALRLSAFGLPTANHALFEPGGEERFFAATPGKTWSSGAFGCIRSEGRQMHEGLDIRSVKRDRRGEPADPVMAAADGVVAYVNRKPGLSNYGNYVVVKHLIEGMEVFTLYAHLAEIREGLAAGTAVKEGETIGIMGRTTNTQTRIGRDRAHVHFEINLVVNDRFAGWYHQAFPGQRNDHGNWNGQNLLGLDARLIFLQQRGEGAKFSLVRFLGARTELFRVLIREKSFPWARRYPQLVAASPQAKKEGVAGYEASLDYNGVAFRLVARAASELKPGPRFQLVGVNDAEQAKNPCRQYVVKRGGGWRLGEHGLKALELLAY
jgi:murein DD-endopeptidase MepM/ murein hydrolase activator NlpD